ncbi:MAG: inorganic diphosphatase [Neisseriales bacterium]|jgi:inorganic pyrophosphatase|nr:MAG: inorganic diphosphatase [Neisseriales bacterium]HRG61477.1 inorganic diphosphatase [Burkholderiales bacterium]
MNLKNIEIGSAEEFNVVIEIPAGAAPVKYEMNKEAGVLFVDRFVSTAMSYPANYGFIPNTLSEDGDPADVVVITPYPVAHGSMIKCRPLGVLRMEDESGIDAKIIAIPTKKVCAMYAEVEKIEDLPALQIQQIVHFFENYKKLEKGKWVKLSGIEDAKAAIKEVQDSIDRYK